MRALSISLSPFSVCLIPFCLASILLCSFFLLSLYFFVLNRKSIWKDRVKSVIFFLYFCPAWQANEMQISSENCFFIGFPIPHFQIEKLKWKIEMVLSRIKGFPCAIKPTMDMHIACVCVCRFDSTINFKNRKHSTYVSPCRSRSFTQHSEKFNRKNELKLTILTIFFCKTAANVRFDAFAFWKR